MILVFLSDARISILMEYDYYVDSISVHSPTLIMIVMGNMTDTFFQELYHYVHGVLFVRK